MSKLLSSIAHLGIVFGLFVSASACIPKQPTAISASRTDKLAVIMERERLIIATSPDYPPQSELKVGATRIANTKCAPGEYTASEFVGFDVDIALEIARRIGIEPCFVTPPLTQIFSGGWADRWDISIASISITSERTQGLYFAQPYSSSPEVFYVHRDNKTLSQFSDLSGKRVGVCAGCLYEAYLERSLNLPGQKIEFPVKNAQIVAYQIETDALVDLAIGDGIKLDAVMTSLFVGEAAIKSGMPLKPLNGPAFVDYTAAAIDKKSGRDPVSFIQKISEITRQMHRDGTLLKLSQQYYGLDFTTIASQFDINTLGQIP